MVTDQGSDMALIRRAIALEPKLAELKDEEILKRKACQDRRGSYPLGILFYQGQVSSGQHYAGRRYMGLFVRAVRGVGVASVLANMVGEGMILPSPEPVQDAAEVRTAYLAARRALRRSGHMSAFLVDRVAVYEDVRPDLIREAVLRTLHVGLDALKAHFDGEDKARR